MAEKYTNIYSMYKFWQNEANQINAYLAKYNIYVISYFPINWELYKHDIVYWAAHHCMH